VLQLSQHIALFFVVTAFWHVPHGHLGVLGPGFVSVSEEFAISNRHRYNCTFLLGLFERNNIASPLVNFVEKNTTADVHFKE
jgi:hypothetical protein